MYKKQANPIFFPAGTNILPRVFSIKNLIWPPDPLNKGKLNFLLHFWAKVPLFPPLHPCGNLPNIHGCLQHSEIWPFSLFKTQFQTINIHEGHISENMAKLNKVRPLYFLTLFKFEKKTYSFANFALFSEIQSFCQAQFQSRVYKVHVCGARGGGKKLGSEPKLGK